MVIASSARIRSRRSSGRNAGQRFLIDIAGHALDDMVGVERLGGREDVAPAGHWRRHAARSSRFLHAVEQARHADWLDFEQLGQTAPG